MRFKHALVLTALVSGLLMAPGIERAGALVPSVVRSAASAPPLVVDAAFTCGMYDGTFSCKAAPAEEMHGKNASPGVSRAPDTPSDGLTGNTRP